LLSVSVESHSFSLIFALVSGNRSEYEEGAWGGESAQGEGAWGGESAQGEGVGSSCSSSMGGQSRSRGGGQGQQVEGEVRCRKRHHPRTFMSTFMILRVLT
jgi:hypothetical protein